MSPTTERDPRNRSRDPALTARVRKTALLLALVAIGVFVGFIVWTAVRG